MNSRRTLLTGAAFSSVLALISKAGAVFAQAEPAAARGAVSLLPPNFANPPNSPIGTLLKDIPLPRLVAIETAFDRPVIADVARTFLAKLRASRVLDRIRPGMRLAIGAGSRGITNLPFAAFGFAGMSLCIFLALQAAQLWQAVLLFGLGSFCVSAWSAQEFALLQHQLPSGSMAAASGIYNGVTTLVGGSLGPLVTSSVLDGKASALPLVTLCGLAAALLAILAARLRY